MTSSRAVDPAWTTKLGKAAQASDLYADSIIYTDSSGRVVCFDVIEDSIAVF